MSLNTHTLAPLNVQWGGLNQRPYARANEFGRCNNSA